MRTDCCCQHYNSFFISSSVFGLPHPLIKLSTNISKKSVSTNERIMWPVLLLLMWGGVALAGSQCERSSAVRFSVSSWRNQTGHRLVAAEMRSDVSLEDAVFLSVDQWTERCGAAGTVALSVTASSAGSTSVATTPVPTTIAPITVQPAPRPSYDHLPGLGYYKLHEERSAWEKARRTCESEGAHLAVLDSREEYEALFNLSGCCPFMGVHRQDPYSPWMTVLGRSLPSGFNAWAEDEPSGDGGCASLGEKGGIFNYYCDIWGRFLCELKV